MRPRAERRWQLQRWISWVRLVAVPVGGRGGRRLHRRLSVSRLRGCRVGDDGSARGRRRRVLLGRAPPVARSLAARGRTSPRSRFDTADRLRPTPSSTRSSPGTPVRQLLFFPVVEAALRYGLVGGVAMPLVQVPILFATEWLARGPFRAAGLRRSTTSRFPLGAPARDGGDHRLARRTGSGARW